MYRLIFTVLFMLCTITPAHAERTVVGTGIPEKDIESLQKAVDGGGTLLLKGKFDLGETGRITIRKNITVTGELDGSDLPITIIKGGLWSFYSPLPVKGAPPASKGPLIVIKGIHFKEAKGTPLHFPHVGGVNVENCTISDIRPQTLDVRWSDGDSLLFQAGIVVGNRLEDRSKRIKRAAMGTIRIDNNRFYMETDRPRRTAGYGVMIDWTWGADVAVTNNRIERASRNGIEILDNVLGADGKGNIRIDNNRIITANEGIPYPHKYGPNGIVAGWYFDTSGGVNFNRNNRISLTGNRIEVRGEASTGMLLYANDIVATCNDVIVAGGSEARGIVQTGSRGFFANNRIRGEGRYAVYCHPFEALKAISNTFAWSNVNDFIGIKGQILLGGSVNVVIGSNPSFVDRGKGNRLVEASPCSLPEMAPEDEAW